MSDLTPWEKYKQSLGSTRPWDFLNPSTEYALEGVAKERYDICKQCPELIKATKQCKQCGCLMPLKVKLEDATCPIKKWEIESIFISVASYRDPELKSTLLSAIESSYNPKRLFFSIVSQGEESEHPDLSDIEQLVGGIEYKKINYKNSMGACWARSIAQEPLTASYTYFLQIDSHMRFNKNWDTQIISKYKKSKEKWDKLIYTTYVYPYSYNDEGLEYFSSSTPTAVHLKVNSDQTFFEGTYKNYEGDTLGEETNYFSGHFAFGESDLFIETPYDGKLYFSGEEPSMAARFNDKDVSLVIPPINFLYHRYDRVGRTIHWDDNEIWWKIDESSKNRLKLFFDGDPLDGYGVSDKIKLDLWKSSAVMDKDAV